MPLAPNFHSIAQRARSAARVLAMASTQTKNLALTNIASALDEHQDNILFANNKDQLAQQTSTATSTLLDRLLLDHMRLSSMASDVRKVASLPDPIGEQFDVNTMPNGLILSRRRVPIGVIGAIYESRPNITTDIASLCLKSGNAVILRGGSESIHSNTALAQLIRTSVALAGLPEDSVQFIESTDHSTVDQLLAMNGMIDLLIPRGGANLIRHVAEKATMPTITGGIGVCHTYIDHNANLNKATNIAYNAKVQRPTVCNALDTLLVHKQVAHEYLPMIGKAWINAGVEIHADARAFSILGSEKKQGIIAASDEDWGQEFLGLIAAVKVVDSLDEALDHIQRYGSGHSEAIVTEDDFAATRFLDEVDAAVVLMNASTRFTDGGEFGLGTEVAISTSKMHARGPMGLRELTSYKWIVVGSGHVRN